MENSSESDWQRSGGRYPRRIPASHVRFSGDTDQDSGIITGRTEKGVLGHYGNNEVGYCKEDDGAVMGSVESKDVSLRQWLDNNNRVVNALDCLHIFMQIVETVNLAHSQGFVVQNVRPSCFVLSSFNRVSFIESVSCSDSDSCEDDLNNQRVEFAGLVSKAGRNQLETNPFPMKQILEMEANWYTSPEEAAGAASSCACDVYRLGVLLFELYCTSSSVEEKNATMSSLRHRVFPPQFLLQWPKVAVFCLCLLHPDPASRPKIGEVLQSELLGEPRDELIGRERLIELKEKINEEELLLEFLLMLQQRKQESADILRRTISFISSDIQEVTRLQTSFRGKQRLNSSSDDSASSGSRKRIRNAGISDNLETDHQENATLKSSQLMKNFKKLEAAYFSTRRRAFKTSVKPMAKPLTKNAPMSSDGKGSTALTEKSSANNFPPVNRLAEGKRSGWINSFLDGLSKYLSFKNLEVKASLNQGDLLNSSNLVCSLGFDRDGEFFATAGVNKKIKVFEYDSVLNGNRDIHYPVVEMSGRSKLSSICWNHYIKGQIASSNFEGVVQIWDVTGSQLYKELKEHERRVWSVDFSRSNPTLVASGSDDCSVKLWNINQAISFEN